MNEESSARLQLRAFVAALPADQSPVYVGIDPGATGAIGFINGNTYLVIDIPTMQVSIKRTVKLKAKERRETGHKTKSVEGHATKFDHPAIVKIFKELKNVKPRIRVCLEIAQVKNTSKAFGRKGSGSLESTALRVGIGYGMWPLFLASKYLAVIEVGPSVWKKKAGLGGRDKEFARHKALSLFPRASLSRKADHNRAEALLLAHYLRTQASAD